MLDAMQRLLEQFQSLYESKLAAVEKNKTKHSMTNEEVLKMQVDILRAYVTDLAEQNLDLIQTAALLQAEAEDRVKILEKLLSKTTVTSKDYMLKITDYQQEVFGSSNDGNGKCEQYTLFGIIQSKFKSLEAERNALREHNAYLVHQISTLIQAVYRGQSTGCWDFSSVDACGDDSDVFLPIEKSSASTNLSCPDELNATKEQLPCYPEKYGNRHSTDASCVLYRRSTNTSSVISSPECTSSRISTPVTDKDVLIKRLQVDLRFLEKGNGDKSLRLLAKDKSIASLQSQITELRHELALMESECEVHTHSLRNKMDEQRLLLLERSRSEEIVRQLRSHVDKLENQINGTKSKQIDNHSYQMVSTSTSDACTQTESLASLRRNFPDDSQEENQWQELVINGLRVTLSEKEAEIQRLKNWVAKEEGNRRDELIEIRKEDEGLWKNTCDSMAVRLEDAEKSHQTDKLRVMKLEEELHLLETTAQENRLILTNEIAERHDTIRALRQELADQAEHQKEIVQQLVLKSEVIKSLRKTIKQYETESEGRESKLMEAEKRLLVERQLVENQSVEMENQKITIANLQEALVQVKRNNYSHSSGAGPPSMNGGITVLNGGTATVKLPPRPPIREVFDI